MKILTVQLLCSSHPTPPHPFHTFFLQFPPQHRPKVTRLRVCLCLFVCFCLSGSCSTVQSGHVRQLRQMWLPVPSSKKRGSGGKSTSALAIHTPVSPRGFLLPVTWLSPPGSSVVCGQWTRPVKRGQSQRWCWSH